MAATRVRVRGGAMSLDGPTTKQAHAEFLRRNATAAHVASAPVLARPLAAPVQPVAPSPPTPGTPGGRIEWQNIPKATGYDSRSYQS